MGARMGAIEPISIVYVYNQNRKILLTRNSEAKGGKWSLPGGHIEFGETIFAASKREALEELSLDIRPIGVFGTSEKVPDDFKRKHYILFHVICSAESLDVKIDEKELAEYVWAPREKALSILRTGGLEGSRKLAERPPFRVELN